MPNSVPNQINGSFESDRAPDSPTFVGGRYALLEMGAFNLSASAGDLLTRSVNGLGRGRIIGALAKVVTATTDAAADGTITVEINGTAVTGGVITVADTADGTNPFTTVGKIFQSTLITAANTFDGNDYIDVAWATTNAFDDGRVAIILVLEYGLNV